MSKIMTDKEGNVRFQVGTQHCANCKTKEQIIQFEHDEIIKGLPVTKILFFCKRCAARLELVSPDFDYRIDIGKIKNE